MAFTKHLHLSVIRSVKEQCRCSFRHLGNRFVSAVSFAASAEEANYTPGAWGRQHLLREKSGKIIAKPPAGRQAHDLAEDMNKGYLQNPSAKLMHPLLQHTATAKNKQASVAAGLY
ncbi:hypothetical protein [Chromobacterium sp. IIBBL 290-4]|uniref:hypothetical protein n=1 Tax=Chromobacterium sp. IIBBL 290-4 TaxID=2953890 RepID=UPI0020B88B85|nr:hypothetical protein [Chromobacterium sp. IIBBL 290-4]UTH74528.1 hypothetical protein NKT35_23905 [Chromobacterium sp. IIBBL 290-4]